MAISRLVDLQLKPHKTETKYNLEELTLEDVIETLVRYNVKHCKFYYNRYAEINEDVPKVRGFAMDDKKLILIDKEQGDENIRESIIHELIHTKHYRKGDLYGKEIERVVQAETVLTYMKLYGGKTDSMK